MVASANVIVDPTQTVEGPVIATGRPFTVNKVVAFEPHPVLYVTVTVPPAIPTIFEPLALAIVTSLVLQVPPALASESIEPAPAHTFVVPVIATGAAITVIG